MDLCRIAAIAAVSLAATGCMNLATKPAEITGSYTSDLKYAQYSCQQLAAEVNSLARREDQLATAQEQRRKTSKVQAFWMGYGNGDGIEASELANVRGEKEAVRRAMEKATCERARGNSVAAASPSMQAAQAQAGAPVAGAAAPALGAPANNWRSWGSSANQQGASQQLYRCPNGQGGEFVSDKPAVGCSVINVN